MSGGPAAITPREPRFPERVRVTFQADAEATVHEGFTADVSAGGFSLSSDAVMRPGTRLRLSLSQGGQSVQVEGTVIWGRAGLPAQGRPGVMGVRLSGAGAAWLRLVAALSEAAPQR